MVCSVQKEKTFYATAHKFSDFTMPCYCPDQFTKLTDRRVQNLLPKCLLFLSRVTKAAISQPFSSPSASRKKSVIVLMSSTVVEFEFPELSGLTLIVLTQITKENCPINCTHVFCVLEKSAKPLRMLLVTDVSGP